ncbi:MAG: hypothetical protein IPK69_05720 [Phycisphaerales bacterium]|nr:MAG: hypothetical protein IPK69_05720 [Phycisphaerales bacterium]
MRSDHRNRTGPSANRASASSRVRATVGGLGLLTGLVALTSPSMSALAQTPSWQYIPPLTGETYFFPTDMSDSGIVVGGSGSIGNQPSVLRHIERYDPASGATQPTLLTIFGSNQARISGDGQVVGGNWRGGAPLPSPGPALEYSNGDLRLLPSVIIQGERRNSVIEHLSHDGTSAAMTYYPFQNGSTVQGNAVYRWSVHDDVAQLPPSPLLGTTYSFVNGMSDDGRYIVGQMAPDIFTPDSPFAWDTQQSTLAPFLDLQGQPMGTGRATAVSGDGSRIYGWYYAENSVVTPYMISNGITEQLTFSGPLGGLALWPIDASFTGDVLIGPFGSSGSWIWTEQSGAMLANDYFRSFGLDFPATARIRDLMVSGDGRHFAGWMESGSAGFVVTIPAPGVSVSFILAGTLASTRRRRRPDALRA